MSQIQSAGDFLSMMRRRMAMIIVITLAGAAIAAVWVWQQPRIYEAIAVAQIESPTVSEPATVTPGGQSEAERRLRLLEQQLMARDNLRGLIERYGLYRDTDFSDIRKVAQLREAVRITQITDPNAAWGAPRTPTGMMITVQADDPEVAAEMANDFLDQLVALNRQRSSSAAQENLEFYKAEAARVEAEMATLEARIAEFKEKNAPYLPAAVTAQRSELSALKTTLLEIEQKLIELDGNRTRQRAEVIERQSALLKEQQALIQSRIGEIEDAIASAPEVERQSNILDRQLDQLKEQHTVLTRGATEAEMGQILTSQDQFERIEVLENALVPENPVSGSRKKKVALGTALSLMLGMAAAFLLEVMNPVIRTPAQLERELNVKAVIAIPKLTSKVERRRKKLIWVAVLLALLALIWAGAGMLKDAAIALLGQISRRSGTIQ